MTKISRSPQRHTFQKEGYIQRCEEKGEEPNQDYLDMFEQILNREEHKFDDPKARENNLEWDLISTDWILEKVRNNDDYAQSLYAALCNNDFTKLDVIPILKGEKWSCSWRYAGGIIADMQQKGDYIDWYCSGIQNVDYVDVEPGQPTSVSEGFVTEEIKTDLKKLGWIVVDNPDE